MNPAGCHVSSFKTPSKTELEHDFLWRVHKSAPERGRIGVFNRSHYEEVLVVRVHPEYLQGQRLPSKPDSLDDLWAQRYRAIADWERFLAENGTVVIKFFLNVSKREQAKRFLSRVDEEKKNWKFSAGDLAERERWHDYMKAYEAALRATSKPWAPWYSIPADSKSYMRRTVADIVVQTLRKLHLPFPKLDDEVVAKLPEYRAFLENELK